MNPATDKDKNEPDMALRYDMAYQLVLTRMPSWKRRPLEHDLKHNPDGRHVHEFLTEVAKIAENMDFQAYPTTTAEPDSSSSNETETITFN